ncbi:MAG: hypothetical protein AAF902_02565 [Chloroflexota bacterium]
MELKQILRVLQRWAAVIAGVVVILTAGIYISQRSVSELYSAQVRLQLTAPDRDDVRLVDEYRYVNQREEATLARNNFTEISKSDVVYESTQTILGLDDSEMDYSIEVSPIHDSDFVVVKVLSNSESNLIEIANVHVAETIKALGNTRALSSEASSNSFSIQLEESVASLEAADLALAQYLSQNQIVSLDSEIQIEKEVIETLEIQKARLNLDLSQSDELNSAEVLQARISEIELQIEQEKLNQLVAEQSELLSGIELPETLTTAQRNNLNQIANSISNQTAELVELRIANLESQRDQLLADLDSLEDAGTSNQAVLEIDALIAERRSNLARLISLEPEYNVLNANAKGALETYELVLEKYNESQVRAEVNRGASFVQIVDEAFFTSLEPSTTTQFVLLGMAVGLILGILIAFLLDYFYPNKPSEGNKSNVRDFNEKLSERVAIQPLDDNVENPAAS